MNAGQVPRAVVIGDAGVGKSSLVTRASYKIFDDQLSPTVGAGVTPMTHVIDGKKHPYHLWDTAGQEIFRNIVPMYFRDAKCIILVFSLHDPASFNNLDGWLELLKDNNIEKVDIILVGNKSDLEDPLVDISEAKKWAFDHSMPFFRTSAASGENVSDLFDLTASICISSISSGAHGVIDLVPQREVNRSCC